MAAARAWRPGAHSTAAPGRRCGREAWSPGLTVPAARSRMALRARSQAARCPPAPPRRASQPQPRAHRPQHPAEASEPHRKLLGLPGPLFSVPTGRRPGGAGPGGYRVPRDPRTFLAPGPQPSAEHGALRLRLSPSETWGTDPPRRPAWAVTWAGRGPSRRLPRRRARTRPRGRGTAGRLSPFIKSTGFRPSTAPTRPCGTDLRGGSQNGILPVPSRGRSMRLGGAFPWRGPGIPSWGLVPRTGGTVTSSGLSGLSGTPGQQGAR